MARPRKLDSGLPKCVYERRGKFYLVKGGRWYSLGANRERIAERAAAFVTPTVMAERTAILRYSLKLVARTRANAKGRRGIPFGICRADVEAMLRASHYQCAVTGTPLSLVTVGRHRPFAPSIDRRDSSAGYTKENCRVVCMAANFAMNAWGEDVLRTIATHMIRKR